MYVQKREKAVSRVFASPSEETRRKEIEYERSAYVQMEDPVPLNFNVNNIITHVAKETSTLLNYFEHKKGSYRQYLLIFPTKHCRDKFVGDEVKACIEGVWIDFKAWKVNQGPWHFSLRTSEGFTRASLQL